ncbi:MAG: thioredoxin [Oscillospiraceae bacterium]|nr:thioredoxin [Oscillospiraceae bacterium]
MAVKKVTSDTFETEVLKSEKTVIADFNADWCGPCKMLAPVLEEVSDELSEVKFVSINVDDEETLAEDNDISSIPCLIVFKNGEETNRSVGLISKDELISLAKE